MRQLSHFLGNGGIKDQAKAILEQNENNDDDSEKSIFVFPGKCCN
jgi:hypothetical protein